MSELSQPLSTCSRTTDFSFVFNNDAFSDAVLVLLVSRPKGASISRRLISSVAQLWLSAAQVTASTVANTVAGAVPAGDALHTASKLLDKYGADAVGWLAPREAHELAIANVYQVNSALLAASSPYLRHLIQHPPALQHLVPGMAAVAARNRQRKLVAVMVQPQHLLAAEAVVRFIFTNDIALTGSQEALHALLVAEQLAVPDCAEVCQHYLEDCAMDWQVALTLVHLQHKHQQDQHQQRQQQWQQLQQQQQGGSQSKAGAASVASTRRPQLVYQRAGSSGGGGGLLRRAGGGGGAGSALDAVTPLLPVPSESVYLQGLLLRAQDFLLRQFEDLELVLGSAEGRQQLLLLPYDALRAILGHPRLKVASENTALLAAAGWLAANAAQVSSLLLSPSRTTTTSSSAAATGTGTGTNSSQQQPGWADSRVQSVYNSGLYNSSSNGGQADGWDAPCKAAADGAAASPATPAGGATPQEQPPQQQQPSPPPPLPPQQQQQEQQQQPPTACGVASLLLDLCQVLRLCQLSYTYVMHVLPHLPLFKDQPQLVTALQFEVLRYQGAGDLRQRRLTAVAAAAAAAAAAAPGLTGSSLAGLEQQQQLGPGAGQSNPAATSTSAENGPDGPGPTAAGAAGGAGVWPPAKSPKAAGDEAWGSAVESGTLASQGWRGDGSGSADAALLQCRRRPESALSGLDFTFSFDPQALAGSKGPGGAPKPQGNGGGSGGGNGGGAGGASSGMDLVMQRLLGLAPQQQQQPDTLLSEDHFFGGYAWNMVVASDGFVGVSWRVVLPGGGEVPLAPAADQQRHQQQAAAAGGAAAPQGSGGGSGGGGASFADVRLFGPDCAGFRSPEVAVTFSITSSGLSRGQRSSSGGSFATGAPPPAANGNAGGGAGAATGPSAGSGAAAVAAAAAAGGGPAAPPDVPKPGGKAEAAKGGAGGPGGSPPSAAGGVRASQPSGGSPMKGAGKPKTGRAYTEVQFVPAHCAWGFPEFAGGGGWDALRGPDGKVCLRCQLKHRE